MIALRHFLGRLKRNCAGSAVIETALVMPPLLLLSIGSFDISRMLARQSELQKAANEAGDIVLAATPDTDAKKATVKSVIMTSSGLSTSQVTLSTAYRCGTDSSFEATSTNCNTTANKLSTYIKLVLSDSYAPMWTKFGVGSGFTYSVTRQVQIS